MEKFQVLDVLGEGAYGTVVRCKNKKTGQIVAVKKFKESDAEDEIVAKTTLREVQLLRMLNHPNIVSLLEVFRKRGKLFLVFEIMERNLLEVLEESANGVDETEVKHYIFQLCRALRYCHRHKVLHRDIKPENLLINRTEPPTLKLCDFGFARTVQNMSAWKHGMSSRTKEPLTDYVATRWYRAPELLLGTSNYGPSTDTWAVACIMGELLDGQPVFPGESELDQLHVIQQGLGALTSEQRDAFQRNPRFVGAAIAPKAVGSMPLERRYLGLVSKKGLQFMKGVLKMDPSERLTDEECVSHPYFDDIRHMYPDDPEESNQSIRDENSNRGNGVRRSSSGHLRQSRRQKRQQKYPVESDSKVASESVNVPNLPSLVAHHGGVSDTSVRFQEQLEVHRFRPQAGETVQLKRDSPDRRSGRASRAGSTPPPSQQHRVSAMDDLGDGDSSSDSDQSDNGLAGVGLPNLSKTSTEPGTMADDAVGVSYNFAANAFATHAAEVRRGRHDYPPRLEIAGHNSSAMLPSVAPVSGPAGWGLQSRRQSKKGACISRDQQQGHRTDSHDSLERSRMQAESSTQRGTKFSQLRLLGSKAPILGHLDSLEGPTVGSAEHPGGRDGSVEDNTDAQRAADEDRQVHEQAMRLQAQQQTFAAQRKNNLVGVPSRNRMAAGSHTDSRSKHERDRRSSSRAAVVQGMGFGLAQAQGGRQRVGTVRQFYVQGSSPPPAPPPARHLQQIDNGDAEESIQHPSLWTNPAGIGSAMRHSHQHQQPQQIGSNNNGNMGLAQRTRWMGSQTRHTGLAVHAGGDRSKIKSKARRRARERERERVQHAKSPVTNIYARLEARVSNGKHRGVS